MRWEPVSLWSASSRWSCTCWRNKVRYTRETLIIRRYLINGDAGWAKSCLFVLDKRLYGYSF